MTATTTTTADEDGTTDDDDNDDGNDADDDDDGEDDDDDNSDDDADKDADKDDNDDDCEPCHLALFPGPALGRNTPYTARSPSWLLWRFDFNVHLRSLHGCAVSNEKGGGPHTNSSKGFVPSRLAAKRATYDYHGSARFLGHPSASI